MEFFHLFYSHGRKPRSNYRRPSSLGIANTPLPDQSEAKGKFTPLSGGRSHIVAPLKDHLKPEGNFEKTSEIQAQYRNLSPSRPVIHKLKDTLKVSEQTLIRFGISILYIWILHAFVILEIYNENRNCLIFALKIQLGMQNSIEIC